MNIIEDADETGGQLPNAVGTPNATEDVYRHRKPGKKRARFYRYLRINLPRLTKALLMLVIAVIGGSAVNVALSSFSLFPGAEIALWLLVSFCILFLLLALATRRAIWDFGSLISAVACVIYIGGTLGTAPQVVNGASIYLAATWNVMLLASLAYFVLNWAVNVGILVVWPKTQGFTD